MKGYQDNVIALDDRGFPIYLMDEDADDDDREEVSE